MVQFHKASPLVTPTLSCQGPSLYFHELSITASDLCSVKVRVPYKVVGLVVGPKGTTIKRIQQQTHTYIVTPSREKDPVFEVSGKQITF